MDRLLIFLVLFVLTSNATLQATVKITDTTFTIYFGLYSNTSGLRGDAASGTGNQSHLLLGKNVADSILDTFYPTGLVQLQEDINNNNFQLYLIGDMMPLYKTRASICRNLNMTVAQCNNSITFWPTVSDEDKRLVFWSQYSLLWYLTETNVNITLGLISVYSGGKSTHINCFLKQYVAFTGGGETTAAVVEYAFTSDPHNEHWVVEFLSKQEMEEELDKLDKELGAAPHYRTLLCNKYREIWEEISQKPVVHKLSDLNEFAKYTTYGELDSHGLIQYSKSLAPLVKKVVVFVHSPVLKYVRLVDTPGWAGQRLFKFAERRSKEALQYVDAVAYLASPGVGDISEHYRIIENNIGIMAATNAFEHPVIMVLSKANTILAEFQFTTDTLFASWRQQINNPFVPFVYTGCFAMDALLRRDASAFPQNQMNTLQFITEEIENTAERFYGHTIPFGRYFNYNELIPEPDRHLFLLEMSEEICRSKVLITTVIEALNNEISRSFTCEKAYSAIGRMERKKAGFPKENCEKLLRVQDNLVILKNSSANIKSEVRNAFSNAVSTFVKNITVHTTTEWVLWKTVSKETLEGSWSHFMQSITQLRKIILRDFVGLDVSSVDCCWPVVGDFIPTKQDPAIINTEFDEYQRARLNQIETLVDSALTGLERQLAQEEENLQQFFQRAGGTEAADCSTVLKQHETLQMSLNHLSLKFDTTCQEYVPQVVDSCDP